MSHVQNKKSIKTLYIISWNTPDAFLWPFMVLSKWLILVVNRKNYWNDHWTFFAVTSFSNTLLTVNLIWNFPIRPERKLNLGQKNFEPYFSFLNCVMASVGVPFCYRMSLEGIGRLRNVIVYDFRQVQL